LLRKDLNTAFPEQRIAGPRLQAPSDVIPVFARHSSSKDDRLRRPKYPDRRNTGLRPAFPEQRIAGLRPAYPSDAIPAFGRHSRATQLQQLRLLRRRTINSLGPNTAVWKYKTATQGPHTAFPEQRIAGQRHANPEGRNLGLRPALPSKDCLLRRPKDRLRPALPSTASQSSDLQTPKDAISAYGRHSPSKDDRLRRSKDRLRRHSRATHRRPTAAYPERRNPGLRPYSPSNASQAYGLHTRATQSRPHSRATHRRPTACIPRATQSRLRRHSPSNASQAYGLHAPSDAIPAFAGIPEKRIVGLRPAHPSDASRSSGRTSHCRYFSGNAIAAVTAAPAPAPPAYPN